MFYYVNKITLSFLNLKCYIQCEYCNKNVLIRFLKNSKLDEIIDNCKRHIFFSSYIDMCCFIL